MNAILLIVMLAITVEALVEYGKSLYRLATEKDKKNFVLQLAAVAVAIVLALLANADLYSYLGVTFGSVPGVGCVLTGIFLSRGSNYISDFIGRIRNGGGYITIEDYLPEMDIKLE